MATTSLATTPTIIPRPSGFEVDDAIELFLGRPQQQQQQPRTYHNSLSAYYKSRKSELSASNNPAYRTFRYSGQGPAKSIHNRTLYHKVVISASVTEILPEAFYNWRNLEQVIFEYPSQCTKIGAAAFYGCHELKRLDGDTLPDSLQTIGANAFACSGLESITLPESLVAIRQQAFRGCTSLTTLVIPNAVKTIHNGAFQDCTNLQMIMLPRNIKRLEANLFANCQSLSTLDVHGSSKKTKLPKDNNVHLPLPFSRGVVQLPPKLLSIGDECFLNCYHLGPYVRLPLTITSLGNYVLEGCRKVEEVVLPHTCQVVGDGCFRNCHSLERLWLSLDVAFGVGVFAHCHQLHELVDIETNHIICL